ncbi:MAG: sialidase family protein [Mycobacteriales bacterium]|nr:glycoside hydrolase [Frankia sp.]
MARALLALPHRRTAVRSVAVAIVAVAAVALATAAVAPASAGDGSAAVAISGSALVPASCPVADSQVGSEVEPRIEANPMDPKNLIAVWQQDRSRNGSGSRAAGVATSFDGGKTWAPALVPGFGCVGTTDDKVGDQWISFGPDGIAYISTLTVQNDDTGTSVEDPQSVLVVTSGDGGRHWSPPSHVADLASIDAPTITADPYRTKTAYVTWSHVEWYANSAGAGGETTTQMFARTDDGGKSWSTPRVIAVTDLPFQQILNPQILVPRAGTLVSLAVQQEYYYDTAGNAQRCFARQEGDICGRVTVRSQTSTDGGASWSTPVAIASGRLLDEITDPDANADGQHQRVRSSWGWYPFSKAQSSDGHVYAAWINRDLVPKPLDGHKAEIQVADSRDGGRTWLVRRVMALTSDAWQPTIAVSDRGIIGLTWYDLSSDKVGEGGLSTDVWFASSRDGGLTWKQRRIGGPFDLRTAATAGNLSDSGRMFFIGDYSGLTFTDTEFVAGFSQAQPAATAGPSDIFAVRLPPS